MPQPDFTRQMKSLGIKCTRHRMEILESLAASPQPLGAEGLFLKLRERGVSINLSSIYRNLETLEHHGLVRKSTLAGADRAVWDLTPADHTHHLVCSACGRIQPVDGCPLHDYEREVMDRLGFDVTGHRLELYGLCRECRLRSVAHPRQAGQERGQ